MKMIRNTYSKQQQKDVLERILEYAEKTMDSYLHNPCLSKREIIMIADAFLELKRHNHEMLTELTNINITNTHARGARLGRLIEKVSSNPLKENIT